MPDIVRCDGGAARLPTAGAERAFAVSGCCAGRANRRAVAPVLLRAFASSVDCFAPSAIFVVVEVAARGIAGF